MRLTPTAARAFVLILAAAASVRAADRPAVPDFGLMVNEDADLVFFAADPDPAIAAANLDKLLDGYKGEPIGTLVYSIACGSDILHYPTKAGSTWGWRDTPGNAKPPWDKYLPKMKPAADAGLDSVRVAADWCKRNNVKFVPTYRINDAHFVTNARENALTGRFWVENGERLRFGKTPMPGIDVYAELLDFSHAEVRAHRMAIVREAAERYAPVMDGFQLDFMRHPHLFPDGKAEAGMPLVTEMIAEARKVLDELGAKHGKFYPLMVRVPPTLEHCRKTGLDVEKWMRDRLVDVVTPSQAMSLGHDMPIDEFVKIAKPAGVKVYPALLDRAQFAFPFVAKPDTSSYAGVASWEPLAPVMRGAVVNGRAMGADGFETYNYQPPFDALTRDVLAAAADATPARGARVYAVTPRYYFDNLDLYEPPKQLPAKLTAARPATLTMYVGEDVAKLAPGSADVALRVGLYLDGRPGEALGKVTIRLNGKVLHEGPVAPRFTAVTGKQSRTSKHVPPPVQGYVQIPLDDLSLVKPGRNEIVIHATPTDAAAKINVSEVYLGVLPR